MQQSLFNILIYFIMILMSFLSLFFNNLFILWIILEISSMSFSIMLNFNMKKKISILFFFISNLTSMCILFNYFIVDHNNNEIGNSCTTIMTFSLWLKLGMFPLNYWMNLMMKNLNYNMLFPLLIISKFIPMIMFILFVKMNYKIMSLLILSLLFPAILSFNIYSFPLLMNYSSMFHMSLMILISNINQLASIMYFLFYSLSTFIVMKFLNENKIYNKNSLNSMLTKKNKKIFSIIMFIYAQLPPFTAFSMKWFMIENLNFYTLILISFTIMVSTIIMTFNYLSFMTLPFFNHSIKLNYNLKSHNSFSYKKLSYPLCMILTFMLYLFNFIFI